MTRTAFGALIALLLLGAAAVAYRVADRPVQPIEAGRSRLALLTSLPLVFGEQFGLDGGGSSTLSRLEQSYTVEPIALADTASLAGHRLLLMAHPRAQPAEVLVELDAWVRGGGRLLLLADPKLDWHSGLPLGDPLRPPPDFADTGLLAHWGLRLEGPTVDGPTALQTNDGELLAVSPGRLTASGSCAVGPGGLVARCAIGKGAVTVIADADFLNLDGEGAIDGPTDGNLDYLMAELARVEAR